VKTDLHHEGAEHMKQPSPSLSEQQLNTPTRSYDRTDGLQGDKGVKEKIEHASVKAPNT
jgi:hypothetical protein